MPFQYIYLTVASIFAGHSQYAQVSCWGLACLQWQVPDETRRESGHCIELWLGWAHGPLQTWRHSSCRSLPAVHAGLVCTSHIRKWRLSCNTKESDWSQKKRVSPFWACKTSSFHSWREKEDSWNSWLFRVKPLYLPVGHQQWWWLHPWSSGGWWLPGTCGPIMVLYSFWLDIFNTMGSPKASKLHFHGILECYQSAYPHKWEWDAYWVQWGHSQWHQ